MPRSGKRACQGCDLKNRRIEGFVEAPHYGSCVKGMHMFPRLPSKDASPFRRLLSAWTVVHRGGIPCTCSLDQTNNG